MITFPLPPCLLFLTFHIHRKKLHWNFILESARVSRGGGSWSLKNDYSMLRLSWNWYLINFFTWTFAYIIYQMAHLVEKLQFSVMVDLWATLALTSLTFRLQYQFSLANDVIEVEKREHIFYHPPIVFYTMKPLTSLCFMANKIFLSSSRLLLILSRRRFSNIGFCAL